MSKHTREEHKRRTDKELQKKVNALYKKGVRQYKKREYVEAYRTFIKVNALWEGYKNTDALLDKVIEKMQTESQRK